jgi:thiol-disulfide isomerase/thioredoxin
MKALFTASALALLLTSGSALAAEPSAAIKPVTGRWDAVLTRNGAEIPFRLDIKGDGADLQGVFYDGFQPYDGTTNATFKDGKLTLRADHYLTTINASLEGGVLTGAANLQGRESSNSYGFRAVRHVDTPAAASPKGPSIAGNWVIPLDAPSSKGEKAFHFVVREQGDEVAASILRIDGDTGSYTGKFKDGRYTLSHFDGGRPGVIVVTPKPDGTLEVRQRIDNTPAVAAAASPASDYAANAAPDGRYAPTLIAHRPDVAQAKGLAAPDDPLKHTVARDPNEKFTFNFPDASGKLISSDDPQFKDKVVVAIVTGTWCPNCHDEAQYLVKLDKQYRDKGLRIVALSFEEPEQLTTLQRAKAFIKQYGVQYTYLFPGSPAQMWEKVPQLNHLDTWPATLFVGRDGKIDAVHSGFASPASGEFHEQLKKDFEARIERLLVEKPATRVAVSAQPDGAEIALAQADYGTESQTLARHDGAELAKFASVD